MTALNVLTGLLLAAALFFFIAGTVGLLRFPDLYSQLHALTKADNVGLGLTVLALMLQAESGSEIFKLGLIWVLVLGASSLLNAAYFLPILFRAWFKALPEQWPAEHRFGKWETSWMLLLPLLVTAALVIWAGVFAESSFSPLAWVKRIATREYAP